MVQENRKPALGRESCMFHVRIRTFSLGSVEDIFFLGDCCGTTFWLSAVPSGRAVYIGICGELGRNSCKRDRTVCSPRMRCDYIFAQHVRISLPPRFVTATASPSSPTSKDVGITKNTICSMNVLVY